jgi:GPI-anchor transamidase subunit T
LIKTTCPLADHTQLHVWLPSMNEDIKATLSPNPTRLLHFPVVDGHKFTIAQYNITDLLAQNRYVDISFAISDALVRQHFKDVLPSPVFVTKFATGHGQEESGIECLIRNRDPTRHFRVILLDHMPWYMRIHFRTFRMELNGHAKNPLRTHFLPSRSREQSGHLELLLHLPPESTVRIQYTFSKLLQRWNEYPPDPHHGFYVPPSTITVKEWKEKVTSQRMSGNVSAYKMALEKALPQDVITYTEWFNRIHDDQDGSTSRKSKGIHNLEDNGVGVLLFSEPILVTFPTPDFSMPFNVLCMVSTLLVLLFMTVHRHCTTILIFAKPTPAGLLKRVWVQIQSKLLKTQSQEDVKDKQE